MTEQEFSQIEPAKDAYVKLTYLHNRKEFTDFLFYEGRRGTNKALFGSRNWARDFLLIKISQIVRIDKIND